MENILEIKDLKISFKTFFGEVEAVRGINFDVGKKETVAIVGESGCGKSVPANSIMQLLPMPPAFFKGGEILFNGENLLNKTEKEMQKIRGNKISMVFQDPMTSLNPTMRIGDQIVEGLKKHRKLTGKEAEKKAIEMLELVSVPQPEKRVKQYPHEFSGGMRQRVMIALAMVCTPELLIADEPTTALDVTVQAQILDLMKKLQDKLDMSIILITHDLGVISEIADRVIIMYAGRIVEESDGKDIFLKPLHPYTEALLKSVPKINTKNEKLYMIKGMVPDLLDKHKGCLFAPRCEYCKDLCLKEEPCLLSYSNNRKVRCYKYSKEWEV